MWASGLAVAWSGFNQPAWVLLGVVLDFCLGDPFWRYHPLHLISLGADRIKMPWMGRGPAVAVIWLVVVAMTVFAAMTMILVASDWASVWLFRAAIALFTFWGLSTRNLVLKTLSIYQMLVTGHTDQSRIELGQITGHEVARLSPREVVRTAVESVADNLSQNVVAPMLFALIGGPAFLWLYKAIYAAEWVARRDSRASYFYRCAHWAHQTSRLIPDTITGWAIFLIATTEGRLRATWVTMRRSTGFPGWSVGLSQAALAGALGLRLGGPRVSDGVVALVRPVGQMERAMEPSMILLAVNMMIRVTVLLACAGGLVLVVVTGHWL